jgi:Selenoprotein SelK_SelG
MPSYIDGSGNLVQGKPKPKGVIGWVSHILWSIVNFVFIFFQSMCSTKSAKDKTTASGGVVNRGGKWTSSAGKPGGGDGARSRPAASNIRGVGDFKPDPCASGG